MITDRARRPTISTRFDPDAKIDAAIDTPQARVALLKALAEGLLLKAGVKVNLKRLYAADIQAVRELLHLALLLYRANSHDKEGTALPQIDDGDIAAPLRGMDLHAARRLVSEVAHAGASLHDRLCAEPAQYEMRERYACTQIRLVVIPPQHSALAVNLDVEGAEASVREALASTQEALDMLQSTTTQVQEEARCDVHGDQAASVPQEVPQVDAGTSCAQAERAGAHPKAHGHAGVGAPPPYGGDGGAAGAAAGSLHAICHPLSKPAVHAPAA